MRDQNLLQALVEGEADEGQELELVHVLEGVPDLEEHLEALVAQAELMR